ncbi:alpha/beta hydrolase [Kineosporia sp. NBRC 101731]|uniref:alpha/beta hydrolase n=1 Tax=Kineosporia sp. NBRC 101731 TaxID=3032199 RepID=UPI0024A13144|nr:alpha/beta hydrolase [Kineosporia sp. NBRC 101731]GLY26924.1 peptidase [Kineosporia sp. NBRC 101731]
MLPRAFRRAGTGVLISAVAGGVLLSTTGEAVATVGPSSRKKAAAAAVDRYDAQKLHWRACLDRDEMPGLPDGYYRLECATLLAPRDWNVPQGGVDIRLKVSRLKSLTAAKPGMLFTNPGGPGADGADLPLLMVSARRKKLMASQDVYGMDVRGGGGSSNITCGGAQNLTADPRLRSEASVNLQLDAAELTARACDVAGRELSQYVTTSQTIQDVDLLRRIAGHDRVNWLGFSAGTWMGAHYATRFPEHAGHLVFDSNVDFTGTWENAFSRQPLGFQRRFEHDFAPWVARYHNLYGLGPTPKAVIASYEKLRARMTPDAPVQDAVTLDDVIAGTMYAKVLFPDAAASLADLNGYLQAQGSGKFRTADRYAAKVRKAVAVIQRDGLRNTFSGDANSSVFLAVTCQDTPWNASRGSLVKSSAEAGKNYPLIGWSTIDQPCAFWNRPAGVDLPTPTGQGVQPVLMVQSVNDPATPIEGARAAAANFEGARLLTVTGEGDHGLYAGGNSCVDKKVDDFIINGKLPPVGATCKGTALPDPTGVGAMSTARLPVRGTNPLLALRQISELVH